MDVLPDALADALAEEEAEDEVDEAVVELNGIDDDEVVFWLLVLIDVIADDVELLDNAELLEDGTINCQNRQ